MSEDAKTYSQMQKDFFENFTNKILPIVQKYEKSRKNKLVLAVILFTLFFVSASIVLYFVHTKSEFSEEINEYFMALAISLYMLSFGSWFWIKKEFENSIKSKIMPTVCNGFGDFIWSKGYTGSEVFAASCAIPKFTTEIYDDVFEGSYKDVKIDIVEAEFKKFVTG